MAQKLDPVEEKLQRRARNLAACIERFLGSYQDAMQRKHPPAPTAAAADSKAAAAAKKQAGKAAAGRKPASAAAAAGKKAKAAKDPQVEAWAALLADLDERINKKKACSIEDIYRAVGGLPSLEQQMLSSIIATTTAKMLPEKQMSEPVLTIKDGLFGAAAAHSFRQLQVPDASKETAAAFRQRGLPADCALSAGFTAAQLLNGGFSAAELVQLVQSKTDLRHLRAAGISVPEIYQHLPEPAAASMTGVEGAIQLKAAGFSAQAVQAGAPDAALSMWDLKLAGYGTAAGQAGPGAAGQAGSQAGGRTIKQQQDGLTSLSDVNYFRAAFRPLMTMQPGGIDLPHLNIGTKDKLVLAGKAAAAEEPQTAVMLAPNPVKRLAQQRKRSGVGAVGGGAAAGPLLLGGPSQAALRDAAAGRAPHSRLRGPSAEHRAACAQM